MTEQEYRLVQEYLLESATFMDAPAEEAYGLAWLAYRKVYGEAPGHAPLAAAWGLTAEEAQGAADAVDYVIDGLLHEPNFDQDQER